MRLWTFSETQALMRYLEASDEERMDEKYAYVHHMMYNEGNHPGFPKRTLSAITAKIRNELKKKK